ncbi:MAG: hypothetical protein GIW98_01905 [Candidatus Eremiobacteraeota bacterium]|nr:hypothetical protein [Candidatus Eremiobacteraeota bacterium]
MNTYDVPDTQMAAGSTLGSPKAVMLLKPTGAIEKFFSIDAGLSVFGALVVHHWDRETGIPLPAHPGTFTIHPHLQEHAFTLSNGAQIRERLFVLSGKPNGEHVDPAAAYYEIKLSNPKNISLHISTYAFFQLRGDLGHDVSGEYDSRLRGIMAWNKSNDSLVRVASASIMPTSYEISLDHAKAINTVRPGTLSNQTDVTGSDPLGIFHFDHDLDPAQEINLCLTLSLSTRGKKDAQRIHHSLPPVGEALSKTARYYEEVLRRAVVITPDSNVNRGVHWAKANMLRTQLLAPTGWCFVNDPTRSNNSVARDTAWFAFGADYITPEFSRHSLLWYINHLEKQGMAVEYYDIRNGKTADYHLNINDDTPLLIIALWHHFNTTGDRQFLESVYDEALRAARYILSQRNEQGLVWATASGTSDWGIVGWRNVIKNYRLSGATTELNSECYAALGTISHMARVLGHHDVSAEFRGHAQDLRHAINEHLKDPKTGLYYLNIDLDGSPRSDITCDLVFPVMFGVADDDTAALIITRLSIEEFWTEAGIRTVPRTAPNYGPVHGYGLLGGVWVGVTFWFAFAAAKFNPEFMAYALSTSFRHYSKDPGRNNTVPGQFSEWLHGETLVNQGMMLSPWFPPRYLWAAIEGAAGLDLSAGAPSINPRLAPDWKWLGVQNLPWASQHLTWFVVRAPDIRMYTNFQFDQSSPSLVYQHDCTDEVQVSGDSAATISLRKDDTFAVFVGNTTERTINTAIRFTSELSGSYAVKYYNNLLGAWHDGDTLASENLLRGVPIQLDRKGFCVMELRQEV